MSEADSQHVTRTEWGLEKTTMDGTNVFMISRSRADCERLMWLSTDVNIALRVVTRQVATDTWSPVGGWTAA